MLLTGVLADEALFVIMRALDTHRCLPVLVFHDAWLRVGYAIGTGLGVVVVPEVG